jgi:ParB family chromosome partitioning protein
MAKRMPLPPEAPRVNDSMLGFAGVISKIPTPPKRVLDAVPLENTNQAVAIESQEVITNTQTEFPSVSRNDSGPSEMEIPIGLIDISPFQPRIKIDEDELRMLAESIDADGQINPIVVRRKTDGRLELIGGERRWRAMQLLKRSSIRVIVKELTDADTAVMAVADNDARQDLTDYERGRKYRQLLDEKFVSSQSELARRIGRERLFIVRCMAFYRLPAEVIPMLDVRPSFLGARNAATFATFMDINEGKHADLVLESIRKIFDGKLDAANAINWLKGQVRARENPSPSSTHHTWTRGGKQLGEMKIDGRKLVITCASGVTPDELMNAILSADQVEK